MKQQRDIPREVLTRVIAKKEREAAQAAEIVTKLKEILDAPVSGKRPIMLQLEQARDAIKTHRIDGPLHLRNAYSYALDDIQDAIDEASGDPGEGVLGDLDEGD